MSIRLRQSDRVVAAHRHGAVARQRPAEQGRVVVQRDRGEGDDVAFHDTPRPDGGGATDLPPDVFRLGATDEVHRAGDGEGTWDLYDERGVGVAPAVEGDGAGQTYGRRRAVDAGRECRSTQVRGDRRAACPTGQ